MAFTGKVTSHDGHIQIQIGSSWGKVVLINGQQVMQASSAVFLTVKHTSLLRLHSMLN